jgi:hypothetical protein
MFELWLFDLLSISYLSSGRGYRLWEQVPLAPETWWDRWHMRTPVHEITRESSFDLLSDGRFAMGA